MTAAYGERPPGLVTFVGAGPGAADLLTIRAARAISEADVVIWASSLVQREVLTHARADAVVVDSAALPLEGVEPLYRRAFEQGLRVARVHSGDPALWGAVAEQRALCDRIGIAHETVPGVSAMAAAAAVADAELTVPEVAQSVVLTRLEGGKTPMPAGETVRSFAAHGATMALFLSAARARQLQQELLVGGYAADTPCVVAYRVSWDDEAVERCLLGDLAETVRAHRWWKHTLILVGPALDPQSVRTRSHLYHPGHFHGHRRAEPGQRRRLRGAES